MTHVGQEFALGAGSGFSSDFGLLQLLLRALVLSDVFDGSFVVKKRAASVTDRARVFGNPDHLSISAIDLGLKPRHGIVLVQEARELGAPGGVDIELPANVGE